MPAKSKQQQKFFGVVKAMQKGDIPKKGGAGEVADDMDKKEVDKMASTKHKGLPKKIKEMIDEELQALNEVKPFVDDKLRKKYTYPLGDRSGLVYLATNDKRYPTELVIYNINRDVFHFVHSQMGNWNRATTETVDAKTLSSTHWVQDYFEDWKEDFEYEKGFKENVDEVKKDAFKLGYRIPNIARAKSHFKQGEEIAAVSKSGKGIIKITDISDFSKYPTSQWNFAYIVEAKLPDEGFSDPDQMREAKNAKSLKADYDKAVKKEQALSSLLLVNLEKYKSAKAKGDEKAIAKHTKIAADLSKKKRSASEVAQTAYQAYEDAISGLHADAELDLKEGKLNEEDYKYKKYVTKAFNDVSDAIFDFRNAMGVKQLGQDDPKIKKQLEAIATAVFALRRDFVSKNLSESKLNEAEINDPVLVAVRARKEMLKQDAIKWAGYKKLSLDQYWKKLEWRSFIEMRMKEAAEELAQLDSEMNHEAGQKGEEWTDDDANRYGGELDKLQTKIEKLAKAKAKVNKEILYHRTH